MADAGWYPDQVDDGTYRWWDGSRWTDHVRRPGDRPPPPLVDAPAAAPVGAPAPAPAGGSAAPVDGGPVVHVQHRALEVVGDRRAISFRGQTYPLAEIDRVAYRATRKRLNGAYMGTLFHVRVATPAAKGEFILDDGSRDRRLDEFHAAWQGLVDLLEAEVVPRLAAAHAATIAGGGTVTYGGIVAGPAGVKAKLPLASTIPWAAVAGTTLDAVGSLQIVVHRDGREPKAKLRSGLDQWNTVVLPRVVDRFTSA